MTNPLVSIGLPVYNGQPYLEETLHCLLGQTYREIEVLVSDNASTDGTESISRSIARRDSRVRYHRNERNLGASHNYNRAFQLASGKYFKWAAADDLCAPTLLERSIEVLENDELVVLCYPRTNIIDSRGSVVRPFDDNLDINCVSATERFKQAIRRTSECNAIFGLIRADALRHTPLIGNFIGSDICLLAELSLHGKFHELPDRLFFRREHPSASSSNRSIDDQLAFFDPTLRGKIVLPAWQRHWANVRAVGRSTISRRQKLALYWFLLRVLITYRGYPEELRDATVRLMYKLRSDLLSLIRNQKREKRMQQP